jgi:hypothetical protein
MKKIFTSLALSVIALSIFGQANTISFESYASKSIYSFIRYINWPTAVTNQDFEIAVIGDKAVYEEVNKLLGSRSLGSNSFKVNYFRKVDEYAGYHHIVFVDGYQSSKLTNLMASLNKQNTLVITEAEGATKKGSMINFVPRDGTIKFELSANNIESHGLKVDSRLASLAIPAN